MVNVQNTQTLIVTLPAAPQTGDVVRMIDVGGNLKYDTTLVLELLRLVAHQYKVIQQEHYLEID